MTNIILQDDSSHLLKSMGFE